jgi:hypothetical protein
MAAIPRLSHGKFDFRRSNFGFWFEHVRNYRNSDLFLWGLSFGSAVFNVVSRIFPYLDLNVPEPKWPGGPCRPAGEKTPPTATLLIKNLLAHPS